MKVTWKSMLKVLGIRNEPPAPAPPESPKADYSTAMNRTPKPQITGTAVYAGFVGGRVGVIERVVFDDGTVGEIVAQRPTTNQFETHGVDEREILRRWGSK